MTVHQFDVRISDAMADSTNAALGTTSPVYTEKEIGKAVKLSTAQNYIHCANDNPIEGFITSVEAGTVNDGYAFGSVQRRGRHLAEVAATYTVAVGDIVVAAAQAAVGTAGKALVRPHTVTTNISNAGLYQWRVIRIVSGGGTAGSVVVLERV